MQDNSSTLHPLCQINTIMCICYIHIIYYKLYDCIVQSNAYNRFLNIYAEMSLSSGYRVGNEHAQIIAVIHLATIRTCNVNYVAQTPDTF